jgi:hypothetical protein
MPTTPSNWLKKTMRLGAGCSKGKHDARADRDAHSPSLHPRMKRGGVCAHLSALNEISSAIEHREIKVFVGPVDANKECIRDVHGVSVFLMSWYCHLGNNKWLSCAAANRRYSFFAGAGDHSHASSTLHLASQCRTFKPLLLRPHRLRL